MPVSSIVTETGAVSPAKRRLLGVVGSVVLLDQLSKHWALGALGDGNIIHVVWTLRFSLGFNSGFAFGTGQGYGVLVGIVALAVVAWVLRMMSRTHHPVVAMGLALVSGGALGNIVDRVFRGDAWMRGKVVDFIDLQWWPVFNVADAAICTGAVVLIVGSWLDWRSTGSGAPGSGTPG